MTISLETFQAESARTNEAFGGRDQDLRSILFAAGIQLEALRLTSDGVPMHPLARGKAFIPYDVEPVRWA